MQASIHRITTGAAARALNLSESSVRRYVASGLLPAVRTPGGRLLVDAAGLDGLLRPVRADAEAPQRG